MDSVRGSVLSLPSLDWLDEPFVAERDARGGGDRQSVQLHQRVARKRGARISAGQHERDRDGGPGGLVEHHLLALPDDVSGHAVKPADVKVLVRVHAGVVDAQVERRRVDCREPALEKICNIAPETGTQILRTSIRLSRRTAHTRREIAPAVEKAGSRRDGMYLATRTAPAIGDSL